MADSLAAELLRSTSPIQSGVKQLSVTFKVKLPKESGWASEFCICRRINVSRITIGTVGSKSTREARTASQANKNLIAPSTFSTGSGRPLAHRAHFHTEPPALVWSSVSGIFLEPSRHALGRSAITRDPIAHLEKSQIRQRQSSASLSTLSFSAKRMTSSTRSNRVPSKYFKKADAHTMRIGRQLSSLSAPADSLPPGS